jgi:hypothetical protein
MAAQKGVQLAVRMVAH